MKLIYVAGKLAAPNNFEVMRHVHRANEIAMEVVKLGAYPVIPHANTGFTFYGVGEEAFWYDGTLELLRRCDGVILVPGWETSKGATGEVVEAKRIAIPVFETVAELTAWLRPGADESVRWQEDLAARFGANGVYGVNHQYPEAPFHVGAREQGKYTHFGAGRSWEEAVKNIKKVKFQRADRSFVFES